MVVGAVALLGWAPFARANCAAPTFYLARVAGQTVELWNFQGRTCPDSEGMLREDVATHEVVKLADYCGLTDSGALSTYIDECVPAGTYRYGFAVPYTCEPGSCGTSYYSEITVPEVTGDCAYSDGDPGPTAASSVPWGDDDLICTYGGGSRSSHHSGCSTLPGSGTVLLIDLVVFVSGAVVLLRARRRRS